MAPITHDDLYEIETVFDNLTGYSMNVDGVLKRPDAASEFVNGIPPDHTILTKHAFLAKHDGVTIGLLDVIDGYPSHGTAFIGLLAVQENMQGKGFGRALFLAAEQWVREKLKAQTLRLAVVASNPVLGFWEKMGFSPTGEVRLYHGAAISSDAILMEKSLQADIR